jgi:hypothetical protein
MQCSFGGTITEEEYKTFHLHHMKTRIRVTIGLSAIIGFVLVLVLINPSALRLVVYTAMFTALEALTLIILFSMQAKQEYRNHASLKYEQRFSADEHGLHVRQQETGQVVLPWGDVYQQKEREDMFLIYPSKTMAFVIPKRFFASSEDVSTFQKILYKHV